MYAKILLGAFALYDLASASYQDAAVTRCCSLLAAQLPNTTFSRDVSNSSIYYETRTSFWSSTEWLDPTCVFLPTTTSDVSTAVAIFSANECPFSIRGGGHSANRGAANIDDGILMSMKHIKDITFSDDESTVTVGAGNTFAEIYNAIEKRNYMIVGGRFGTVGTGLLLGAGFSYFNNRYGLGVDNVAGHRTVLANGTVVLANATHYPDLHWALKGGGNNFGVVTHFELFTIPSTGVYGGRITYPASSVDGLLDATYKYHTDIAVNEGGFDVHVLPTFLFDSKSNTTYGYTPVVYNKNATEYPPSLKPFLDVPHTNNTAKNRRYGEMAGEMVAGFPDGLVQSHYTFTVYPDASYFSEVIELWTEFALSMAHIDGFNGLATIMPVTPRAIAEGVRRGGNALAVDQAKPNTTLSVFYLGVTFNSQDDEEEVFPAWEIFIRTLQVKAKVRDILFPYIMMTYSDSSQQVLSSYGTENIDRFHAVQKAYDGSLVFQRLVTGGQKLPL